ncbi:MAG: ATP-binding cassette domain-containing protein, partial [Verrucomicrobia bacterium]|nr:ATP-binding cassette domain-containing protein [Verrucomicrobiota bacterium]
MNQALIDTFFLLRNYHQLLLRYPKKYLIVLLGIFSQVSFFILYPISFKYIFDHVIPAKDYSLLAQVILQILLLMVFCSLGAYLQTKYMAKVGGLILAELRANMVHKLNTVPSRFYSNLDTVDLLSRFASDMDRLENSLTRALPMMVETVLVTLGCLLTILSIDWRLALAAFVLLPIGFFGNAILGPKEEALNTESRNLKNKMLASVEDFLDSWLLIRAYKDKSCLRGRFEDSNQKYTDSASNYSYCINLTPVLSEYGVNLSLAVLVIAGAIFAIQGSLTMGAFVGCFALLRKVADGSAKTARFYFVFITALPPFRRIQKLLAEESDSESSLQPIQLTPLTQEIRFENVTFGYHPSKHVLDSLNLLIPAGKSVALVGTSGAGKSTITKLVMRIVQPQSGLISFDGVDLQQASFDSLRRLCGAVLQDHHLFRGTIAENIRFINRNATMEEVVSVAKQALIHDLITQLPHGYDTIVDERGSSLSGGQRQRIAIARAFLQNPSLLILDEPSSMLDPATAASIHALFMKLAMGRTVIMVTHRLASAQSFDKIVVLDQGKVAEEGTHQQLFDKKGLYRNLWDKQSGFGITSQGYLKVTPDRLRAIPIFSELDFPVLENIAGEFNTEIFEPEITVTKEGAKGDKFYIAVRGSLQVLKKGPNGVDRKITVLRDGDHFGEIAL